MWRLSTYTGTSASATPAPSARASSRCKSAMPVGKRVCDELSIEVLVGHGRTRGVAHDVTLEHLGRGRDDCHGLDPSASSNQNLDPVEQISHRFSTPRSANASQRCRAWGGPVSLNDSVSTAWSESTSHTLRIVSSDPFQGTRAALSPASFSHQGGPRIPDHQDAQVDVYRVHAAHGQATIRWEDRGASKASPRELAHMLRSPR